MARRRKDQPRNPDDGSRPGFSRRGFLKTVSAGGLATGVLTPGVNVGAQPAVREIGPGPVPIQLTINGRTHKLQIEPRVTLLDALRNRLDMTGVKRVCDRGSCGACTMIVDGRPIYACSTLAIEAQGREIRTIEGFSAEGAMHPVQKAFCENDGLMCGFCTPGLVVATVALLEKHPNPTPEQVKKELDGNICRCGTYKGVVAAAIAAAKEVRRG